MHQKITSFGHVMYVLKIIYIYLYNSYKWGCDIIWTTCI